MARIEAITHVEAPVESVWEVLIDWEAQARWMEDARSVEVRGDRREGPDVAIRARTAIVPGIVVNDDMVVTEWEQHRLVGIRHVGPLIRGVGAFELSPTAHGTHVLWWEEIDPPFGSAGNLLAQVLVVPYVTRVFRISLAGLKHICESR